MPATGPNCSGCPLEKIGSGFTQIEIGPRYAQTRLMLIGEASGESEARESLPFRPYAQSGSLLVDSMKKVGMGKGDCAITNVIRCRPPKDWLEGAPWAYGAIAHCTREYLIPAIKEMAPRAILALGGTALRALTSSPKGKYGTLDYIRGYVQSGAGAAEGIPVLSTYHPAFLRRGKPNLAPLLQRDLKRSLMIAAGQLAEGKQFSTDPSNLELKYETAPTLSRAWEWHRSIDPSLPIYFDIETPRTSREDEDERTSNADRDINLVQFTQRKGEGIAVPYREEFQDFVRAVMGTENLKVGHNNLVFDLEVMSANGIDVHGEVDDTMVMWGRYQPDLPANLQAVAGYFGFRYPWKHLAGIDNEWYGIADVDALAHIYPALKLAMEREDLWTPYVRYFRRFWLILRDMAHRGLPIDEQRRIELGKVIELDTENKIAEMRRMVPIEVLSPKHKAGLKRLPKEVATVYDDVLLEWMAPHQMQEYVKSRLLEFGYVEIEVVIEKEEKCVCLKKVRGSCVVCVGSGIIPSGSVVKRWTKLIEFNPNSSKQVKSYIAYRKHKQPKHPKRTDGMTGEPSDTTEVKELERLAEKTGDPLYRGMIELRQLAKIAGTYVDGWKPQNDGRLRTTFTYRPATWQTSCCAAWSQVLTQRGYRRIEDVRVGDMVWTHKRRWRTVITTWIHPPQPMVRVQFWNGAVLTCTTSHRLLLYPHGYTESMVDGSEHRESIEGVSTEGLPLKPGACLPLIYDSSHDWVHTAEQFAARRVQSFEEAALLEIEAGEQKSNARQDGSKEPTMEGSLPRWVRIFDLIEGAKKDACSSDRYVRGLRVKGITEDDGRPPHQRGPDGQPLGQPRLGDVYRSLDVALPTATGLGIAGIEKIICVGSFPVHDITVEEDESYTSYGVFSHNSRQPNIQNGLKRGRSGEQKNRAKAFNLMQRAEPGHVLVNFDFKSFHAQTTACEAGLADYLRLAKIDVHSFNACHFVKHPDRHNLLSLSDSDLKAFFKEQKSSPRIWTNGMTFKEIRDGKTKSAGLGIGFGMRGKKLYQMYQEDFASQKEAEGIWNLIMIDLFPGLLRWQEAVKAEAAETGILRSKFGAIRRFHDVQRFDRKSQRIVGGDQGEAAIAFLPAASAFGMIREALIEMDEQGLLERFELVNSVHDSLVFHPRVELVEECLATIIPIMEAPSKVLVYPICPNGLDVEAESSVGESMAELK